MVEHDVIPDPQEAEVVYHGLRLTEEKACDTI
jgi:hypothetical protein